MDLATARPTEPAADRVTPHTELTRVALDLVRSGTTTMADSVLRVPLDYYTAPDQLAREQHGLLSTVPLALVPSARIGAPHDYVVRDVIGTSVLVTRGSDGTARAFLNYCRHRGARPADGCGSARRFTCPYHAWSYDGQGQLVGMPGSAGFDEIDRSDYGLVELPAEERHGFVWVVLTAGAPLDLDAHLGPLDDEFATWDLGSHQFVIERDFTAAVNWKAALEAFSENYHFPYVHGNSIVGMNTVANTAVFDRFGHHFRLAFPCPWIDRAPAAGDYDTPLDFMALIYWVYPNLIVAVSTVGVELIEILPGSEPVECTVRHGWMATAPATDDETMAGYLDLYELVHAAVRDEDFTMLPSCGDGSVHGQHDHMVIGRNEIGVQHVVRTLSEATSFPLEA